MMKHSLIPQIERVMARVEMLEQKQREMRETYASNLAALTGWYESAIQRILSETDPPSRVHDALASIDEQLAEIRAQNVTPRRRSRKKAEPKLEETMLSDGQRDVRPPDEPIQAENQTQNQASGPQMVSQQGTCDCETCRSRHGQQIVDGQTPPYHEGCDCKAVPQGTEQPPQQPHEASAPQQHTGMMVAFMLDPETAKQLAVPGGESPEDMHITLAFMGNKDDFQGDIEHLKATLADFAASAHPLQGKVAGIGQFIPSASSDGKVPFYASVDVPGLTELRTALVSHLEDAGYTIDKTHGYTPHITLAYR